MKPVSPASHFPHALEHNYFTPTTQPQTTRYQHPNTDTSTCETSASTSVTSTPTLLTIKHSLKKPTLAIPIKVCHTPWRINTHKERRALLAIHHKSITRKQKEEYGKDLKRILTKSQINRLITRPDRSPKKYNTHRIIYIYIPPEAEDPSSDLNIWENQFRSQTDLKAPDIISRKKRKSVELNKQKILNLLKDPFLSLFKQIETFSISLENYKLLKDHVFSNTTQKQRDIRHIFFPGVKCIRNKRESSITREAHPAYNIASKTYLKITRTQKRTSKVHSPEQEITIQRLKTECFLSIQQLEKVASEAYQVMCPTSFTSLLYNAVRRMEDAGVLSIDKTQDFNAHYVTDKQELSIELDSTITTTVTPQKDNHKQPHQEEFIKTAAPIKVCYTPFDIQTKEKRKALLAIHHKKLSKEEKTEYAKAFEGHLSKTQIKDLIKRKRTRSDYYTHRIIYIPTPKARSNTDIWTGTFTSQKESIIPIDEPSQSYQEIILYKEKMCDLLSPELSAIFAKIELFSITIQEYSKLKAHIKIITDSTCRHICRLFFPGIRAVKANIMGKITYSMPNAYLLAARAYIEITQPYRTPRVLTEQQSELTTKMRSDCFSSLKEVEQSATLLQPFISPSSLLVLIRTAISNMEQAGVLPIPQEDINDPDIIEQAEARYLSQRQGTNIPEGPFVEKYQPKTKSKIPRKRKASQSPARSKKRKTHKTKNKEQTLCITTQSDWTAIKPSTSVTSLEAIERSAALTLLSLQYYKDNDTNK